MNTQNKTNKMYESSSVLVDIINIESKPMISTQKFGHTSNFRSILWPSSGDWQPRSEITDLAYIGETERSLKTRFLEHRRPSSTSSEVSQHIHIESPDHHVELEEVKILDREQRYFERGVKEAIYIRVNQPSLNKDRGRYKLPRVYDQIWGSHVRKICDLWSRLPVSWGRSKNWPKIEVCPNFCVEIMGLDSIFIFKNVLQKYFTKNSRGYDSNLHLWLSLISIAPMHSQYS